MEKILAALNVIHNMLFDLHQEAYKSIIDPPSCPRVPVFSDEWNIASRRMDKLQAAMTTVLTQARELEQQIAEEQKEISAAAQLPALEWTCTGCSETYVSSDPEAHHCESGPLRPWPHHFTA